MLSLFRSCITLIFGFTLILGLTLVNANAASPLKAVKSTINNIQDRSSFHGFFRQYASFNTEDPIETSQDDQWEASMIRSELYGDINMDLDWMILTTRFRYDLEYETDYLQRLQELPNAFHPTGEGKEDIMQELEDFEFREWYADFNLGDRFFLRLGKQQVIWGRTDFFTGLDIVHGFDYTWRSFLGENEQIRQPLIMANLQADIRELNGSLQLLFRPGWDREEDIGNRYDLFGGRWANQPNKGNNFLTSAVTPYNLEHEEGDYENPSYGVRWSSSLFDNQVEYTISYLHSFFQDPVVNPNAATLAFIGLPGSEFYKEPPKGMLGDLIFKEVDLVGVTANYYVAPLDIVTRCEIAYMWDAPYNFGQNFGGGALPGFAGIKEKDTVRIAASFDRDVDFVKYLLGSERPGFLTVQVFDTWIPDYDEDDDLVYLVGYGKEREEHEVIGTIVLSWYYDYDRIIPQIAFGADLTNGGGFVIPSVKFAYGDHWRLSIEYDAFFDDASKKPGEIETDTALFGYFDHNDQLLATLTYQF